MDYICSHLEGGGKIMPPIHISDAEQRVLAALWGAPPLTLGEVACRLPGEGWNVKTVKTLLSRLVEKGAVHEEASGSRHRYSALLRRDEVANDRIEGLIARFFDNRPEEMLAFFCRTKKITRQQAQELLAMLEEGTQ